MAEEAALRAAPVKLQGHSATGCAGMQMLMCLHAAPAMPPLLRLPRRVRAAFTQMVLNADLLEASANSKTKYD